MNLERLKPEEKVNLSISMIDTCIHICADALQDQDETIKEEELLKKLGQESGIIDGDIMRFRKWADLKA